MRNAHVAGVHTARRTLWAFCHRHAPKRAHWCSRPRRTQYEKDNNSDYRYRKERYQYAKSGGIECMVDNLGRSTCRRRRRREPMGYDSARGVVAPSNPLADIRRWRRDLLHVFHQARECTLYLNILLPRQVRLRVYIRPRVATRRLSATLLMRVDCG